MSDVQQGADWWLASDGKWYPPQSLPRSRPAPLPPPPQPSPPSLAPSLAPFGVAPTPWATPHHPIAAPAVAPLGPVPTKLTGWLQGLMWATGGVAVITGVLAFAALNSFDNYHGARSGSIAERRAYGDWIEMDDTFTGIAAILFFLWIALFVVTIIWTNKAHKATQRLWHGPRKWTSGWAVGGFFIPAANFFIPKLVINEIERIAKATRSNGLVDSSWRGESTSVLGWLWWIGTAVGLLFAASGSSLVDGIEASADEIRSGYAMQGLAWFSAAVACACGALFIRKVGGRLSPAGLASAPSDTSW